MSRVLVVEPDRRIRKFIADILADFGHHVQQCRDAGDARRWLRQARFDVLATDLVLDEDGAGLPELAERVAVLTLSGRPFVDAPAEGERPPRLNDKPFRLADLRFLVAAIGAREGGYAVAA